MLTEALKIRHLAVLDAVTRRYLTAGGYASTDVITTTLSAIGTGSRCSYLRVEHLRLVVCLRAHLGYGSCHMMNISRLRHLTVSPCMLLLLVVWLIARRATDRHHLLTFTDYLTLIEVHGAH